MELIWIFLVKMFDFFELILVLQKYHIFVYDQDIAFTLQLVFEWKKNFLYWRRILKRINWRLRCQRCLGNMAGRYK